MNSTSNLPHREESDGSLHISSADGVGWIVLDNPGKHNAISLAMWRLLVQALQRFEADASVRCVVVRGQGDRAFCAGADLAEKQGADADAAADAMRQALAGMRAVDEFPKPVIAMVSGYCLGAGFAIALACDLRVAAEDASFGIPAAKLGLAYNYSEMKRLVDLVGPARAKQIVFTADRVTALRALQIGLVDEVAAASELLGVATRVASRIAANAPLTIAAAKHAVALAVRDAKDVDISSCEELARNCLGSRDHVEGLRAFKEKRNPVFRGC